MAVDLLIRMAPMIKTSNARAGGIAGGATAATPAMRLCTVAGDRVERTRAAAGHEAVTITRLAARLDMAGAPHI